MGRGAAGAGHAFPLLAVNRKTPLPLQKVMHTRKRHMELFQELNQKFQTLDRFRDIPNMGSMVSNRGREKKKQKRKKKERRTRTGGWGVVRVGGGGAASSICSATVLQTSPFYFLTLSWRCLMGGGGVKRQSVLLQASCTGKEGVHPFQCKATNALLFTCTSTDLATPPSLFSPLMHGRLLNLIYPPPPHLYKYTPSPQPKFVFLVTAACV